MSVRSQYDQAIQPTSQVKISLTLREQDIGAGWIRKGENPMPNLEEAIRERAYHLWVADGQPDGKAEVHWMHAHTKFSRRQSQAPPWLTLH